MRFNGNIGFSNPIEVSPGIWEGSTVKKYMGNILKKNINHPNDEIVNDTITMNNVLISIVADKFATDNVIKITFVELYNVKWKVVNVEVQRPRIILTLGGRIV